MLKKDLVFLSINIILSICIPTFNISPCRKAEKFNKAARKIPSHGKFYRFVKSLKIVCLHWNAKSKKYLKDDIGCIINNFKNSVEINLITLLEIPEFLCDGETEDYGDTITVSAKMRWGNQYWGQHLLEVPTSRKMTRERNERDSFKFQIFFFSLLHGFYFCHSDFLKIHLKVIWYDVTSCSNNIWYNFPIGLWHASVISNLSFCQYGYLIRDGSAYSWMIY